MKRILLVTFLSFLAIPGFSQEGTNTFISLYLGAGCATSNNYNVAPSAGFEFSKGLFNRTGLGFNLFYQTYALYYDNEEQGRSKAWQRCCGRYTHGMQAAYVFLTPKI